MCRYKKSAAVLVLFLMCTTVGADWIVLNGQTHRDVYVNETRTMYFVHFPDTGEVMNIPKNSVSDDHVGKHEDPAWREALFAIWRENNPERERATERRQDIRRHQERQRSAGAPPNPRQVERLTLSGDVVPKVAPGNPRRSVAVGIAPRRTGTPTLAAMPRQPQQQRYGGMGGMGMGGMGMGGMGMGGMGMGGMGMGGGMGMMGGAGGAGMRDVTVISNISDMFFNIDDRLVGEPLAEIYPSYLFQQRLANNARSITP